MTDRYVYPAIFRFHAGGVDVEFPDLPGCFSHGATQEEAMVNAREALALHLYGLEQEGEPIPPPSRVTDIQTGESEAVVLVEAWMPPVRDAVANKAVKKTLTIPKWLNDLAERQGVNFSQVLQKALKEYLGLEQ